MHYTYSGDRAKTRRFIAIRFTIYKKTVSLFRECRNTHYQNKLSNRVSNFFRLATFEIVFNFGSNNFYKFLPIFSKCRVPKLFFCFVQCFYVITFISRIIMMYVLILILISEFKLFHKGCEAINLPYVQNIGFLKKQISRIGNISIKNNF